MKYLGIDYGTKRIGVAVSDETATLAFPLGMVAAGQGALEEVLELARENAVGIIIMGESHNFAGAPNPVMQAIEKFKTGLEAAGKKVLLEPEYMTSAAASHQHERGQDAAGRPSRKEQGSREFLDSSAAALILQSYLDRIKSQSTLQ